MANKTFNPNDFKKKPPVKAVAKPAKPKEPKAAPVKNTTMPVESNASGRPVVRMMDKISLSYEPQWERVLDNVGVTYN